MEQVICQADELADHQCLEFSLHIEKGEDVPAFVLRRGENFFAYRNHCPHTGVPLNWVENQFLSYEGDYIQCAVHGALFQIEDGFCLHGPCNGQSLRALPLQVRDGAVTVTVE